MIGLCREDGPRRCRGRNAPVETLILKDFVQTLGERVEEDRRVMDRPGRPTDIAPVVSYVSLEGARWFRGANFNCNGGMSHHNRSEQFGF